MHRNGILLPFIRADMTHEWEPFGKALRDTRFQGFAWIVDPRTHDFCSAATNNMQFSDVVRQMAFLLAYAGENTQERETIRAAFLKAYDKYATELSTRRER